MIVEIGSDGSAHCRHLLSSANGDGTFHDLDARVSDGEVRFGSRVEALTFGDVHHAYLDPAVARATWGIGGDPNVPSLVDRPRDPRPSLMSRRPRCSSRGRRADLSKEGAWWRGSSPASTSMDPI